MMLAFLVFATLFGLPWQPVLIMESPSDNLSIRGGSLFPMDRTLIVEKLCM